MDVFTYMITSVITTHTIRSGSAEAFSLHEKTGIGEKRESAITYNPTEALYLLQSGRMKIVNGAKAISNENAVKKLKKIDSKVEEKCLVYSDLRKQGYLLKEGLKFGGDFRAYRSIQNKKEEHALWIVQVVSSRDKLDWREFAAKNRVAHSTKKKILFALIDSEGDVSYYEVAWMKP